MRIKQMLYYVKNLLNNMTEREKRDQGILYDANYDQALEEERLACKTMCQTFNQTPIKDLETRRHILKQLFGHTGDNIHIEPDFWCDYGYNIFVGENFYANHGLIILDSAKVTFGHDVFIGPSCGFHTSSHPLDYETRNKGLEYANPITIGDNVWIGAGVHVLPGVSIGDNVVIGAGSVVVKDIPANTIAVGNPCRVIKKNGV